MKNLTQIRSLIASLTQMKSNKNQTKQKAEIKNKKKKYILQVYDNYLDSKKNLVCVRYDKLRDLRIKKMSLKNKMIVNLHIFIENNRENRDRLSLRIFNDDPNHNSKLLKPIKLRREINEEIDYLDSRLELMLNYANENLGRKEVNRICHYNYEKFSTVNTNNPLWEYVR